jgi:hypothetical protein
MSVRAMMRKFGSRRASTAARMRLSAVSVVDDLLAVEVPAALGVDLVLDVGAGEARVLERLDRARHVHRLAEAGVGVDDRGQLGHAGDLLPAPGDLGEGRQADVGKAQVGREHRARDVDALEALRSMSRADSGLNAPGKRSSSPAARSRSAASRRRRALLQSVRAQALRARGRRASEQSAIATMLSSHLVGVSSAGARGEEPLDLGGLEHGLGEQAELAT